MVRRQRDLVSLLMQQWYGRRSIVGDTKGPVTCLMLDCVFVRVREPLGRETHRGEVGRRGKVREGKRRL